MLLKNTWRGIRGVFRHAWVSEKRSQTLNSGEKHYG